MKGFGSTLVLLVAWLMAEPALAGDSGRVALVPEGKIAFISELERELQASSFDVVRLEGIDTTLQKGDGLLASFAAHQVAQGILLNEGGAQAVLVFVENGELRVKGQYPVNQQDRLARRRLWIWLGEILRATREDPPTVIKESPVIPRLLPVPSIAPPMSDTPSISRPFSLGAASVLGFGSGSSFLGSHILLTGATTLHRRAMIFANLLWPLLSVGEKSSAITRSWAFQLQGGVVLFLGPLEWSLRPYVGLGVGIQLLFVEMGSMTSAVGTTSSTGSHFLAGHLGTRFYISPRLALFLQVETGKTQIFVSGLDNTIASPANAWFKRLGLGIVFDR